MRTGLVAKKIGMSRHYTDQGKHLPVTILKMEPTQVIAHKTKEKEGYNAVVIGTGERKLKNISKSIRGQFNKAKLEPKAKIFEFRVADDALVDIGANLSVSHFVAGQKVDVTSVSKGKGFAGAMKRHNFSGLEASHGISVSHRAHGSTGQCQDPGRVFKGKKMAGQLGNKQVTKQNLEIVETDIDEGLIVVKGAVPGAKGTLISIRDAAKALLPEAAPYPAGRKSLETEIKKAEEEAIEQHRAEEEASAQAAAEELAAAEAKAREEKAESGDGDTDTGGDADNENKAAKPTTEEATPNKDGNKDEG